MKENILVVHGGAPTAVMNASLYGVIREAENIRILTIFMRQLVEVEEF